MHMHALMVQDIKSLTFQLMDKCTVNKNTFEQCTHFISIAT